MRSTGREVGILLVGEGRFRGLIMFDTLHSTGLLLFIEVFLKVITFQSRGM